MNEKMETQVTPQNPNSTRLFIKSTDKKTLIEYELLNAISTVCDEVKLTKLQVLRGQTSCIIETITENAIDYFSTKIIQLQLRLKMPISIEPYDPDYKANQQAIRTSNHVIAIDVPFNVSSDEIEREIEITTGSKPKLAIRITSGTTGLSTKFFRIMCHQKSIADKLLENGFTLYGVLKIRCVPPDDNSHKKRCHKCQTFNHDTATCQNTIRCRHCAGNHSYSTCKNKNKPPICANCNNRHLSSDRACPAWRDYMNHIQKQSYEKKMKEKDLKAKQQNQTHELKKTFAEATKQTEDSIKAELVVNNRTFVHQYDQSLTKLYTSLKTDFTTKLEEMIYPIQQQLNDIQTLVNTHINQQQTQIIDPIQTKLDNIKTVLNTKLSTMRPRLRKELPRANESEDDEDCRLHLSFPEIENTPQTDDENEQTPPLATIETPESDCTLDISTSLQKVETPDPISPLPDTIPEHDSTQTERKPLETTSELIIEPSPSRKRSLGITRTVERQQKMIDFLDHCKRHSRKVCDFCNFTKNIINSIFSVIQTGKTCNIEDDDYYAIGRFRPNRLCPSCSNRKHLILFMSSEIPPWCDTDSS